MTDPVQPWLSAIVLAGGQSSRMGRDKALLTVDGQPLLARVCAAALGCTDLVFVVTPWPERYQALLPLGCHLVLEPLQPDATAGQGPLVGFCQGLTQTPSEWVLLLACDLPRLQGDGLRQWSQGLPSLPTSTIAYLPRQAKGWEPLCGFYRRSCLPGLESFIRQGGRSFQQWLAHQRVEPISNATGEILFNCNTPEDWAAMKQGKRA